MLKRILLGAAGGLLAVPAAYAADLPVAPEPLDYVRVCDAFGAGFYYIPGTDTCLSVRGRVRAEYRIGESELAQNYGAHWRDMNSSQFRSRGYIYMDSRTNTEYGLLRAYNEIWVTYDSSGLFGFNGNGGGSSLTLWNSFVQFGGFTFGRTQSFYDFVSYPTWASVFTPQLSDQRQNLAAYTFAFGNGFSTSLSVESADDRRSDIEGWGYGGTKYPDLVANLRIDQGWGSAQLMGALHQVWPAYNSVGTTPDSEVGWAVGGGVKVNLPFVAGATVNLQGAYTKGAYAYATSSSTGPGNAFGYTGGNGGYDAALDSTGDLELSEAWTVSGGFGFAVTPTLQVAVAGGYLDYSNDANPLNDFKNYDAQGQIVWSPVEGLIMGPAIEYRYVDADDSVYEDGSIWTGLFRVQRTF
ncbi:hypothetical protein AB7M35_000967 [Amorphus suaedae]